MCLCLLVSEPVSAAHAFISHTHYVYATLSSSTQTISCRLFAKIEYPHTHCDTLAHTRMHTLCLNIFPFINFAPYTCTYNLQQPLDNLSSMLAISIVPHHVAKGSSGAAAQQRSENANESSPSWQSPCSILETRFRQGNLLT